MTEIIVKLQSLEQLPEGLHWFCPRRSDDDSETDCDRVVQNTSFGPDTKPDVEKLKRIDEADRRRELALDCLLILAYDGEDVGQHQEYLKTRLDKELGKCDICIQAYYKGRRELMQRLNGDYEEEEVVTFSKILDDSDINRVKHGLSMAMTTLNDIPLEQRDLKAISPSALYALFEALSCETFLRNERLLCDYFDEPFKAVQIKRVFRLSDYVPAVTLFLFDPDEYRCSWASQSWSKFKRGPTVEEFEWAIRDPLLYNLRLGTAPQVDNAHIGRLWAGVKIIVDKLDKELITHSLRAMDIDVCRLALDHLRFDNIGFRSLLQTIQILLQKSPDDFWDAMGAISPTTVVEQIFNNPRFDQSLTELEAKGKVGASGLDDMLSWIGPFMFSLKIAHRPSACRSLVFQLLERLQVDRFPEKVRIGCYQQGLRVLKFTLQSFVEDNSAIGSVGRVVLSDTLEVVSKHIEGIMRMLRMPADGTINQQLSEACRDIVRNFVALECKSLRADHEALEQLKSLPHGVSSYSPILWDAIISNLDRGNLTLARATLLGINDLVGLEKFSTKGEHEYFIERNQFNTTYGHLTHAVTQVLERLGDFTPEDIDKLFTRFETADALIASLFSADSNAYQAAINLIKSVSGQSGRKEAMAHLLKSFFNTTLRGLSWSVRRISHKRTFASTPRMLKTCTDVLDVLCNTQDGLLRTRALSGSAELNLVETWWQNQWQALTVIFEMTEGWNNRGHDKEIMMEFCRDTMQFAERLFEQYSIFSSAMDSAAKVKQEPGIVGPNAREAGKVLLTYPTATMNAMVKWLRLRDEYLASTSVKLVIMLLRRLAEWKMTIGEDAHTFIQRVVAVRGPVRTILTPQEKAELSRALQENEGRNDVTVPKQTRPIKKQCTIAAWTKLTGHPRPSPTDTTATKKAPGTIDMEAWESKAKASRDIIEIPDEDEFADPDLADDDFLSLTRVAESYKDHPINTSTRTLLDHVGSVKSTAIVAKSSKSYRASKTLGSEAERSSFREKREREKEAKRQRDAQELARLKKKTAAPRGVAEQTAGEGSGLNGIGVKGKDHAPKGASMMISSDSDLDSEDDLDRELFGVVGKPLKSSDALRAYQESKAQSFRNAQQKGPVKKSRQIRSAKDMRARLAPDLSSLHKTILSWDFFHEGDFPPSSERHDYTLVSNAFKNPLEYQSTFEPLLILEAWQGFLKAKEEGNLKSFEIKVANRLTVDSFIEVSTSMTIADGKDLGIGDADIVLISKAQSPATDPHQPHCLARICNIARKKNMIDISYRVSIGNDLMSAMVPNASLFGVKLASLTPLEREYGALVGLKYYDLCDEIVKAKPSPLLRYSDKQLNSIISNYAVNSAQAKAVRSAIDNDAFTLIQGPPGSGKTKTIVAIVGAILTDTFRDRGIAIPIPQTKVGPERPSLSSLASKKLLVCAPSNAAVDELVMRLKQGVKTMRGEYHKLSIVRLGRSDAINASVMDVTLDELVNAKINPSSGKKTQQGEDIHDVMMEHKATSTELSIVRARLDESKAKGQAATPEQEREFDLLKRRKNQLGAKIDAARDSGNTAARDAEINRRRIQQEILNDAHVICATLSGSGHEMFQNLSIEFETVIIDEAAQSIELSALIPLKYGCSKCIMVGDPKQLPPTVLSREAARFQYEQSLFVRMQNNHPNDVHLLDTQYRMHPEISLFPSKTFYDGKLLDGANMAQLRVQPWHECGILGPYRFFDVQGTHQSAPKGHSLINVAEIEVALQLFGRLLCDCRDFDFKGKVGIITPYKSQLRELRLRFAQKYGDTIFSTIDFNTTDAFQGRESDIIIFSCVRASSTKGIGFLADIRRMNVGLTRAKSSLWVLGNSQSLKGGEFWARLIQDAKCRDLYTGGDVLTMLRRPLLPSNSNPQGPTLTAAAQGRRISSADKSEDVEMMDVPAISHRTLSVQGHSSGKQSPTDRSMEDVDIGALRAQEQTLNNISYDFITRSAHPSGGGNGLDPNKSCRACGSFAHQTSECDHEKAKAASSVSCYRCGDTNHHKQQCTADRCLECGGFGHKVNCTSSSPLSRREREQVKRAEIKHQFSIQTSSERQRKKQLGDHDAKVPAVRPTRKTPPLEREGGRFDSKPWQDPYLKRKLGSSPPMRAPKGPAAMSTMSKVGNPASSSSKIRSNGNVSNHPEPVRVPSNKTSKAFGDTPTPNRSLTIDSGPMDYGNSNGVDGLPEPLPVAGNGPRLSLPPKPGSATIRPVSKKKDVDPFIRPKSKRPRP